MSTRRAEFYVDKLEKEARLSTNPRRRRRNGKTTTLTPQGLNAPQTRFVLLIVAGFPPSQAYREAFALPETVPDNTARSRASKLLSLEPIQQGVRQRERQVCDALAVDPTFIVGRLAHLATQEDDRKAAVRALELLGRHLQPGFFGDNKPQPKEPSDIKALLADIATVNRELLGIAKARGDRQLEALVQATVIDIAPEPAAITAEPAKISPEESTDG